MRADYVTVQARIKNALLSGQGHYDLSDPAGGELPLIAMEQAEDLRGWWISQILSTWDWFNEEHGILPDAQQRELRRLQDQLAALELQESDQPDLITILGSGTSVRQDAVPWLAYESAIDFWSVTGRLAIELNALGVVSSVDEVLLESIGEAIKEAPDTIGQALGGAIVAVGRTAGEALYGLIKGLGITALIIAGVTAGTIIVLRRLS